MRVGAVLVASVCLVLGFCGPGHAGIGAETHEQSGAGAGSAISSRVSLALSNDQSYGKKNIGPLTPTTPSWAPPPCWYEPFWSAKAFKAFMGAQWAMRKAAGGSSGSVVAEKRRYGDFHTRDRVAGMWWKAVDNPALPGDGRPDGCARRPFWAAKGVSPSVPNALSPAMLAAFAYQSTHVPGTEVEMAPARGAVVNLPAWIWLDRARFAPVSVTARLARAGLWARTTARPVSLRVDPGAAQAVTYPESGECALAANGRIGAPRRGTAGEEELPPCGVTYLKSSTGSTFPLRATLTWHVTWTGSGGTGGELPRGTYGQTREVRVREIQSVVR